MGIVEDMAEAIQKVQMEIIEQREEILRAFIAKYGMDPADCEQIVDFGDYHHNIIRWRIQKRGGGGNGKVEGV